MPKKNLLRHYPKTSRNTSGRAQQKTSEIQRIARQFGKEFFDGDRLYGYGGFSYHEKYWQSVIPDFQKYYGLTAKSSILDIGCAKGFMLYDFVQFIPGITVAGIDISPYAIKKSLPEVKPFLKVANAKKLPFPDKSFDLVISINTIHNLKLEECKQALNEIQRVAKKNAFITVDAYTNDEERKKMQDWNLTARTILHEKDWEQLFSKAGYTGDYFWFMP